MMDQIHNMDCLKGMRKIENESIDLIFADPPYYMQTEGQLIRVEGSIYLGVNDTWDQFNSYNEYDQFSFEWLKQCQRVLKRNGSIWVIGSFQNIYRIGYIMQQLGYWIINDVIWSKKNPTPNFMGTRFTNANEILLWCTKSPKSKYTFNYKTMKHINGGKQMKSVWEIGICSGKERLRDDKGRKLHNTQKPIELLKRVILSSSRKNDVVLDPFMGTGTTAVVSKMYGRKYLGFEKEEKYVELIYHRLRKTEESIEKNLIENVYDIKEKRVPMKRLIENKFIVPGEFLFDKNGENKSQLTQSGKVLIAHSEYSIHKGSAKILGIVNNNGWDYWHVKRNDILKPINDYRKKVNETKNS